MIKIEKFKYRLNSKIFMEYYQNYLKSNIKRKISIDSLVNLENVAREIRRGNFRGNLWVPRGQVLSARVVSDSGGIIPSKQSVIEELIYGKEPVVNHYEGEVLIDLEDERLSISNTGGGESHIIVPSPEIVNPSGILVPMGGYHFDKKLELSLNWTYLCFIDREKKKVKIPIEVRPRKREFTEFSEKSLPNIITLDETRKKYFTP